MQRCWGWMGRQSPDSGADAACWGAQMKTRYGTTRWDLLRASMQREFTLVVRQKFLYLFRTSQVHSCELSLPAAPPQPAVARWSRLRGCACI